MFLNITKYVRNSKLSQGRRKHLVFIAIRMASFRIVSFIIVPNENNALSLAFFFFVYLPCTFRNRLFMIFYVYLINNELLRTSKKYILKSNI